MIEVETSGIFYYRFENLDRFKSVRHGIFSRKGGVSSRPFDSLNVSRGLGDSDENILENRCRIDGLMGGGKTRYARQVHGSDLLFFSGSDAGEDLERPCGDALITARPETQLGIQVADCQPVLVYDPVRHVAAAVHSGWRGSIKNIIGHTVKGMEERFGCQPGDILAGIGPSLGPCCSEFVNFRREIPKNFWSYRIDETHFDFWALSVAQLCDAGLRPGSVELSGICTRCRTDLFYSYRGEKVTGRFAAVIGLVG